MMRRASILPAAAVALMLGGLPAGGWSGEPQSPLTETGHVIIDGHATPYLIRHLPVSSFPQLPGAVGNLLKERGCLIPQTYEAHQPENVIEASLERPGSKDWAVLCSEHGTVSLLVFFGDKATASLSGPRVLATAPETERLQAHGADRVLGFNWGIDSASPEQVREAQAGMQPLPPRLDHDALADSVTDGATVYHFYTGNAWTVVGTGE